MVLPAFNSGKIFGWVYAALFLTLLIAMAGKQAISWALLKLYEFFIQKSPLK